MINARTIVVSASPSRVPPMSALTNGNTPTTTIMIADRAGDIILGTGEYSK